jgi:hypothetical protein
MLNVQTAAATTLHASHRAPDLTSQSPPDCLPNACRIGPTDMGQPGLHRAGNVRLADPAVLVQPTELPQLSGKASNVLAQQPSAIKLKAEAQELQAAATGANIRLVLMQPQP